MGSWKKSIMKLREIFEAPKNKKHVVFCFGRMNPPHYGHLSLISAVANNADKSDWFVFTSKSQDRKKNPLPYASKIAWLRRLFPQLGKHLVTDPTIKTYLQAAAYLYSQGYTSATFVAGDDDLAQMQEPLEQYNGVRSRHGEYNFQPLTFVANPRETSATNARTAAIEGDEEAFIKATGVASDITVDGLSLFQATRAGLGLDNEVKEPAIDDQTNKVAESTEKKITKRQVQSSAGLNTYGDSERMSGDYTAYRLGMALAGADGKTPIDMKAKSWVGKRKTAHPYTQEEQDMLKQAYKVVGANYKDLNHGDMTSKELETTEVISPVAKVKKNKYGV
jgi:cytidyltransferase-like protein